MRGVNKWIGIGALGADPERRATGSGNTVTSIRIAINEQWKDRQTGEQKEHTEWVRVKLFGRLGDIAAEYLRKGRQVYIEGSLRTDKYTDKDGNERYTTEVIANEMQMLGGAEGAARQAPARQRPQTSAPPASAPAADFEDDDIPFD